MRACNSGWHPQRASGTEVAAAEKERCPECHRSVLTFRGLRQLKLPVRPGTYALASIRGTKSCLQTPGPAKAHEQLAPLRG